MFAMKKLHLKSRSEWRRWLARDHTRERDGIWLVYHKRSTGRSSLDYEGSVEEALCFGWIDSIIKRIDEDRYCRKFTPRKDHSAWSSTNIKRAKKLIKEGRMTAFGQAKIDVARRSGRWKQDSRPELDCTVPPDLVEALSRDRSAKDFFEKLAPSYQKQFIGWMITAKKPETRARRLKESLALLARQKRLGLK